MNENKIMVFEKLVKKSKKQGLHPKTGTFILESFVKI